MNTLCDLQQGPFAKDFFFFFNSTSLLLPTHLPPPLYTHAQSCNPMDFSPLDSSAHGFFQARILEWVAISFSQRFLLCKMTSLMDQWLRIHLPLQVAEVHSLVQEDSTCHWTTELILHKRSHLSEKPAHGN